MARGPDRTRRRRARHSALGLGERGPTGRRRNLLPWSPSRALCIAAPSAQPAARSTSRRSFQFPGSRPRYGPPDSPCPGWIPTMEPSFRTGPHRLLRPVCPAVHRNPPDGTRFSARGTPVRWRPSRRSPPLGAESGGATRPATRRRALPGMGSCWRSPISPVRETGSSRRDSAVRMWCWWAPPPFRPCTIRGDRFVVRFDSDHRHFASVARKSIRRRADERRGPAAGQISPVR